MPSKQRITRADFSTLLKERPRRFFGLYWTLSLSPSSLDTTTPPMFACVVSKKVAAQAVHRNHLKRYCREICRQLPHEKLAGFSYVLYAKKEANDASYQQLQHDIVHLLTQARALPREALAGYNG